MVFYESQYLKHFRNVRNIQDQGEYTSRFPYVKHLQAIDSSFVTLTRPVNKRLKKKEGLK